MPKSRTEKYLKNRLSELLPSFQHKAIYTGVCAELHKSIHTYTKIDYIQSPTYGNIFHSSEQYTSVLPSHHFGGTVVVNMVLNIIIITIIIKYFYWTQEPF